MMCSVVRAFVVFLLCLVVVMAQVGPETDPKPTTSVAPDNTSSVVSTPVQEAVEATNSTKATDTTTTSTTTTTTTTTPTITTAATTETIPTTTSSSSEFCLYPMASNLAYFHY